MPSRTPEPNTGWFSGCAPRGDGTAWCWGVGTSGQLGDNTLVTKNFPVQVSNLKDVVHVSAGASYSCATLADGTGWCWGLNTTGQGGDNTVASPHQVPVKTASY